MTRTIAALQGMLMTLLLACALAGPASADTLPPAGRPHLVMRLVAESAAPPTGGGTVTVALDVVPEQGWHGYWSNPGDAGFPAKFDWHLPKGATVSAPRWPVPTTLVVAGLMNHVYERPYALLFDLTLPPGAAAPVSLDADYLVCTDAICVPERQRLTLDWWRGEGAAAAFAKWRRAIPRPLDAAATWQAGADGLRIAVPYPAGAALSEPHFFADTQGPIDYAATQSFAREGDRLVLTTRGKPNGEFAGVLRISPDRGLQVRVAPGAIGGAEGGWAWTALVAFVGAVVGGLILNVMPCVFPILSLKALSLVRGHVGAAEARREALAYTAGVVLVCVALGAAILGLRAGGQAVGWAFQLQSPRVLVVLLLLSVALALNLAGLFEFATPAFVRQTGGGASAFSTGALAAFIATPCTGPFMGAALGAALVLPWAAALAVFAGLGLGLALPFLLLGFVPGLRRMLPKPGGWMETFRQVLSVPMWLTAIALGWVLGKQAGIDGLTIALTAALAAGLVLWIAGGRQRRGLSFGWGYAVALVVVAALGSALAANTRAPAAAPSAGAEAFSEAKLAALRAKGTPVFAYFTADWCLTCKVNERVAIDTDTTRAAFRRGNVAVLVGDWTDGDPALGRFIEAHNRAGVPLYLYYPSGGEARVLPQVLTPGMLAAL